MKLNAEVYRAAAEIMDGPPTCFSCRAAIGDAVTDFDQRMLHIGAFQNVFGNKTNVFRCNEAQLTTALLFMADMVDSGEIA